MTTAPVSRLSNNSYASLAWSRWNAWVIVFWSGIFFSVINRVISLYCHMGKYHDPIKVTSFRISWSLGFIVQFLFSPIKIVVPNGLIQFKALFSALVFPEQSIAKPARFLFGDLSYNFLGIFLRRINNQISPNLFC